MNTLTRENIILALLEEIATADGFAQPDEMNERVVKISKIGWARILKYAHALGPKERKMIEMKVGPNDDIVPTLRMFDGLMMSKAADEIESMRKRMAELEDVLTSARAICERRGDLTAWERLDSRIAKLGIGKITAKTFRVLPSDILNGWIEGK